MKLSLKNKSKKNDLLHQMAERFILGIAGGLGQALGLTLVFAIIVRYFTTLFTTLGGVPYLANLIAKIVDATQQAMIVIE